MIFSRSPRSFRSIRSMLESRSDRPVNRLREAIERYNQQPYISYSAVYHAQVFLVLLLFSPPQFIVMACPIQAAHVYTAKPTV